MSFNGDLYPSDDGLNITTKGSIHTSDGSTNKALAVSGNNGYVLAENSAVTDGIEWILNAHSSVTPSSTTTFTNKSIDFGTNTMTSTLAQLDTALSTTGTADATTFLRGDNSWQSIASGGQLDLLDSESIVGSGSIWNSSTFSANMKTTYSELIFIGNLYWKSPYTEFGDTYINLNGITSGYQSANGYYYDGSTMTQLTKAGSTVGFISDPAMDLASGEGMHVETTLAQVDGTTNIISYHSLCTSSSGTSMILDTFLDIGSTDIITDLKLQASLAGWDTGSNMAIYGRKFT